MILGAIGFKVGFANIVVGMGYDLLTKFWIPKADVDRVYTEVMLTSVCPWPLLPNIGLRMCGVLA